MQKSIVKIVFFFISSTLTTFIIMSRLYAFYIKRYKHVHETFRDTLITFSCLINWNLRSLLHWFAEISINNPSRSAWKSALLSFFSLILTLFLSFDSVLGPIRRDRIKVEIANVWKQISTMKKSSMFELNEQRTYLPNNRISCRINRMKRRRRTRRKRERYHTKKQMFDRLQWIENYALCLKYDESGSGTNC